MFERGFSNANIIVLDNMVRITVVDFLEADGVVCGDDDPVT